MSPDRPIRIQLTILGAALICLTAVLFTGARWGYYIQHYISRVVNVLYSQNEAFVFIEEDADGAAGPRWRILLESVRGIFGSVITDHRGDLLVVHITEQGVQKYFLPNFGRGGGAYPLNGNIYFQRGTTNPVGPPVWKCSGTNFQMLSSDEAHKISNSFETIDELLAKEGWKETNVWFSTVETSVAAPLIRADCRIILNETAKAGESVRSVRLQTGANVPAVALDEMDAYKWKAVARETYWTYFGRNN